MKAASLLMTIATATAVDMNELLKDAKTVPLDVVHEGHVAGFSIGGIWREEDGRMIHHPLKLSEAARRGVHTQQAESFDAHTASGARTRTLLKLSTILTTSGTFGAWPEALMAEIFAAGEGNYASDSYAADNAAAQALIDGVVAELSAMKNDFYTQFYPAVLASITDPAARAAAQIELVATISAITWINPTDNTMALVFRGTASSVNGIGVPVDYFEDTLMHALWAGNRMFAKQKDAWTNDAGLEWDEFLVAEEAYGKQFESEKIQFEREALLALGAFIGVSEQTVAQQSAAAGLTTNPFSGLTAKFSRGTLTFEAATKMVAMAYQYSATQGYKLVLSGHSLGGSRAAAGSMVMAKLGVTIPALTFGAIGSACWTKRYLSGVSLQGVGSLDPGVVHNQITEYVHPLDPYGNLLGLDVGTTCKYGMQSSSKPVLSVAAKWCKPFFAYPGNYLLRIEIHALVMALASLASTAQQAQLKAMLPLLTRDLTANDTKVLASFQRCRYYTHDSVAMYQGLIDEITEDGLTKDGCTAAGVFGVNAEECPYNFYATDTPPDDFEETSGGTLFFVFISMTAFMLLVTIIYCIFTKCCQKEEEEEESSSSSNDSENPPDAAPDSK
eukprot:TRINITY_DN1034_c0_g1_i1.p1 TRINITY_DN1034_c0_g1~~TRINITY_DN1034_c0_g1_i1.p1  ORF type:complete len:641 (+),score=166.96 TRINITY_DN1034_c0_g1_i1:81-1925(+)